MTQSESLEQMNDAERERVRLVSVDGLPEKRLFWRVLFWCRLLDMDEGYYDGWYIARYVGPSMPRLAPSGWFIENNAVNYIVQQHGLENSIIAWRGLPGDIDDEVIPSAIN